MKLKAPLLTALVVLAAVAMPATAAVSTDRTATVTDDRTDAVQTDRTAPDGYAGAHVTYEVASDAVVDYTVDGETMVESMAVESEHAYERRTDAGADVDLDAVADLQGLGLEVAASSETQATVESDGNASIVTHDNEDGTLVVQSGDGGTLVEAELGGDADAEAAADDRVVVETGNGTTGTFIVVGDGTVTVNDDGNVAADLEEDARLVFRESGEERSDEEKHVEEMIANGTATAEVYVESRDGEIVHDTVTYGQNTTVAAEQAGEQTVEVTVERAASQGKVVVTHVSEAAVGNAEALSVTVDGEAAAQAESTSEVRAAAQNGDESAYYVAEDANAAAEGAATVVIGFDHFSERTASIQGGDSTTDDGSDGDGSDGDGSDGDGSDDGLGSGMPGFGVTAALAALVGALLFARRLQH